MLDIKISGFFGAVWKFFTLLYNISDALNS